MKSCQWLLIAILAVQFAACGPVDERTAEDQPPAATTTDLPEPPSELDAGVYPAPPLGGGTNDQALSGGAGVVAYPPPGPETPLSGPYPEAVPTADQSKRFTLEPPRASDREARGTGPAGAAIVVVNLSRAGQELGRGVVGQDGRFEFSLTAALEAGTVLAVMPSNPADRDLYRDAPGATDIPMVGLILTSEIVQP
jgi:hypothetical protein